jgi:hypothetical protein
MSLHTTAMFVLLFAACILCSVTYWQLVYPVILRRVRFHLFEMRDELRGLACNGQVNQSAQYVELEAFICKTIQLMPGINLGSFVWFAVKSRKERSECHPITDEGNEVSQIRNMTARDALLIMGLNSPWTITLAGTAIVLLSGLGAISRLKIYKDTEDFVESFALQSGGATQLA